MDDRLELPPFERLRIAVVGDAVADRYVHARPSRLSREAPVPVFVEEAQEVRPGGAANVAANLAALGCATTLVAPIGADAVGRALVRDLEARSIAVVDAHEAGDYRVPVKTRVLASEPHRTPQQVLRVDREPAAGPDPRTVDALIAGFPQGAVDAVLYSDYGYLDPAVFGDLDARLARDGVVRVLDPRETVPPFEALDAVTPNLDDFLRLAGDSATRAGSGVGEDDDLVERVLDDACAWRAKSGVRELLVTLGNRGMALVGEGGRARVAPSGLDGVVDVSGAGDTAAAVFSASLALDVRPERAMALANAAAGVVVMQSGTVPIALDDLRRALPRAPRPRIDGGVS